MCVHIPLADLRHTDLRQFLCDWLSDQPVDISDIYVAVLAHFDQALTRPDALCDNYPTPHPEYRHLVRWTLQDGRRAGEFARGDARGSWRLA